MAEHNTLQKIIFITLTVHIISKLIYIFVLDIIGIPIFPVIICLFCLSKRMRYSNVVYVMLSICYGILIILTPIMLVGYYRQGMLGFREATSGIMLCVIGLMHTIEVPFLVKIRVNVSKEK